jgi:hypothetical protein
MKIDKHTRTHQHPLHVKLDYAYIKHWKKYT